MNIVHWRYPLALWVQWFLNLLTIQFSLQPECSSLLQLSVTIFGICVCDYFCSPGNPNSLELQFLQYRLFSVLNHIQSQFLCRLDLPRRSQSSHSQPDQSPAISVPITVISPPFLTTSSTLRLCLVSGVGRVQLGVF